MRRAAIVTGVVLVGLASLGGCNDVRDFAGTWHGVRVRDWPLPVDVDPRNAMLRIDAIDKHGLRGYLDVTSRDTDGATYIDSTFSSLEAAEGDVLSTMTFAGNPLRVYLALVPLTFPDAGDALAIISLYDTERIELRLIKGEPLPLYVIYPLTRTE